MINRSICILNNTLNAGGAEKNCVVLCNELVKKGFEVELWITRLIKDSPLLKLIDNRVTVRSIPGKRIRNTITHLKKMLLKSTSKTFLIYNVELLIPVYFINKLYGLNLKIVARSITTLSHNYNDQGIVAKRLWFRLIGYTGNKIDSMIAQSEGMKEDLVKKFNILESKVTVIPNPSYNFDNRASKSKDTANNRNILFVGRITEAKGLNYLLEIFKIASSRIPDLHLSIVGTGEKLQDLKNKVLSMGLSESVSFEGYQSDLASYYKNAKVTVLTSLFEGFPNVLVESISYGTPVISFDCQSGPRDIIIPNINGILVDYLNVTEFAQAIVDVVSENIKFNKAEIIESSKRYSLEKIISEYEKVLF
jgi:glycosyltransferase involved in cell wall biosynthesis